MEWPCLCMREEGPARAPGSVSFSDCCFFLFLPQRNLCEVVLHPLSVSCQPPWGPHGCCLPGVLCRASLTPGVEGSPGLAEHLGQPGSCPVSLTLLSRAPDLRSGWALNPCLDQSGHYCCLMCSVALSAFISSCGCHHHPSPELFHLEALFPSDS